MITAIRRALSTPAGGMSHTIPAITDTFTRADGALAGSTTETGAKTWMTPVNTSYGFNITSGKATPYDGSHQCHAGVDTGYSNGVLQISRGTQVFGWTYGVIFRYVDASNYWRFIWAGPGSGGWTLAKRVSGSWTTMANQNINGLDNDVYRVELSGSSIVVKVVRSGTPTTLATVNDSDLSTATIHGIFGYSSTSIAIDDFSFQPT